MAPAGHDPVPTDAVLLAGVRAGDREALGALYDRYARLVYSVALRVLHDEAAAEDVLQDVFLRVWRGVQPATAEHGIAAWLAVVARNRAIDALRDRQPGSDVDEVMLASNADLASEAARRRLVEQARTALDALPPEQRRPLELAFFEGMTHAEIAERTGTPLGTVKSRIRAAIEALRKVLTR